MQLEESQYEEPAPHSLGKQGQHVYQTLFGFNHRFTDPLVEQHWDPPQMA